VSVTQSGDFAATIGEIIDCCGDILKIPNVLAIKSEFSFGTWNLVA
jgi:hypothetical protein